MTDAGRLMGMVPFETNVDLQQVRLIRAGPLRFTKPFYDDCFSAYQMGGEAGGVELTYSQLRAAVGEGMPSPRALVFHTGRCGSTLLLRMLLRHRETMVVAEPMAVSSLHRDCLFHPEHAAADRAAMGDLLVVLDRFAAARGQRVLWKLNSWQTADASGIYDLVGELPAVFVHRAVDDVVASELAGAPGWSRWFPDALEAVSRFAPAFSRVGAPDDLAEIFAAMWAATVSAALDVAPRLMCFVAYQDLVNDAKDTLQRVAAHLGLDGSFDVAAGAGELQYYAKGSDPSERFDPGGRHRRPPLDAATSAKIRRIVGELPERLEIRSEQDRAATPRAERQGGHNV